MEQKYFHWSHTIQTYGHWMVKCVVEIGAEKREFKYVTTDSHFIDDITDMRVNEPHSVIQHFYHSKFYPLMEEQIMEWIVNTVKELSNQ